MGTTELLQKIAADGQQRAAQLVAEGQCEAAAIRERAGAEVAKLQAESEVRRESEVTMVLERAHTRARLVVRDAVLAARWQVIERVSLLAARSFTSDSGYWELLDGVVKRHARPGDTVRMSERDTRTQRSRQGVKTGTPLPILGGVVIVSGREQKSFALDEALAAARDSLAGELARALFD